MARKVTLRQRKISNGKISLRLDIQPPIIDPTTGKSKRWEVLKMHIHDKPKSANEKKHNKETLRVANEILLRRQTELNKSEIYSALEKEELRKLNMGKRDFLAFFKALAEKRKSSSFDNWISAYKHFETFAGGSVKMSDLNRKYCEDFKEYLLNTHSRRSDAQKLSQNAALSYFNKFKAALKQAYEEDLLQTDLSGKVKPIKAAETHRTYLTLEELEQLAAVECKLPIMKNAALFSALTGLRFSDIEKLRWKELEYSAKKKTKYELKFIQKKTKGAETLPISEQAVNLMGKRKEPEALVFEGLEYSAYNNKKLKDWVKSAGIDKDVTFHSFRHTYATLQLAEGTDLYVICKLLGHKHITTTQLYTKVLDIKKQEAATKIVLKNLKGV